MSWLPNEGATEWDSPPQGNGLHFVSAQACHNCHIGKLSKARNCLRLVRNRRHSVSVSVVIIAIEHFECEFMNQSNNGRNHSIETMIDINASVIQHKWDDDMMTDVCAAEQRSIDGCPSSSIQTSSHHNGTSIVITRLRQRLCRVSHFSLVPLSHSSTVSFFGIKSTCGWFDYSPRRILCA